MDPSNNGTRQITVIGAGIVGMSSAMHLQRAGYDIAVVDRAAPGDGCSFGNVGVIARCAIVPVPVPGIIWKAPRYLLDPLGPLSPRWSYLPGTVPWLLKILANGREEGGQ